MSAPNPENESLLQALLGLVRELPLMLSDRMELLSLELQRAGGALGRIVALVVAASVFGATAWLLLWAGIVVVLIEEVGMPRTGALLLALAFNVLVACAAVFYAYRLSRLLTLPATRRHLTVSPSPTAPPKAAAAAGAEAPVVTKEADPHGQPAH